MKNKDIILLKKILDYCNQAEEANLMFDNNYDTFVKNSVFTNSCCMCVLQIWIISLLGIQFKLIYQN